MDTRSWYVLVTFSNGESVLAKLGPYATRELAERKARDSRVVHYRVERVTSHRPPLRALETGGLPHPLGTLGGADAAGVRGYRRDG
jgi:hypothetical protein